MSDDLQDLVTKEDGPMMSKEEMRKTHANQHGMGMMYKNGKKVKPKTTKKSKK